MKLSEAIRLGSMMKPQAQGALVSDSGGTCAIASALDATGRLCGYNDLTSAERRDVWIELGWNYGLDVQCPACGAIYQYFAIVHLNDAHRWTRERIADWVEAVEAQQEAHVDSQTAVAK